jgi:hypothetical protein
LVEVRISTLSRFVGIVSRWDDGVDVMALEPGENGGVAVPLIGRQAFGADPISTQVNGVQGGFDILGFVSLARR